MFTFALSIMQSFPGIWFFIKLFFSVFCKNFFQLNWTVCLRRNFFLGKITKPRNWELRRLVDLSQFSRCGLSLAKQKHSRLEIHRFYRSKELKQFGLMDEFYLQFWTKWIELSTVIITVLRLNAGIFYKNTKSQGLFSMENIAKWR